MQEVEELKTFKKIQTQTNCYLDDMLVLLFLVIVVDVSYILSYLLIVFSSLAYLITLLACIKIYMAFVDHIVMHRPNIQNFLVYLVYGFMVRNYHRIELQTSIFV